MSSPGNWELVSKSKKTKQNGQTSSKLSKVDKKKFAENAPKVEDILPLAQVKSLYTDDMVSEVHEVKKHEKEAKAKEEPKKNQKKQQHPEKKKDTKEKAPKQSPELDEGELLALIIDARSRYAKAPLAWLRDLAAYITSRLNPSSQPLPQNQKAVSNEWPSSLLPQKAHKAIEEVILEESFANQMAFFSSCMTSMANDMSKGHSAIGQKIMLQVLINLKPSTAVMSIDKLTSIRNSYQNRPPICISLLEMMGLAGHKDINIGLKVWCEVMFPLIEMRNYTRWVMSYLGKLLSLHSDRIKSLPKGDDINSSLVERELYFQVIERILPVGNSLTSQVQKELFPYLEPLRELALHQGEDQEHISEIFQNFLRRLTHSSPKVLQNELLEGLMHCLRIYPECFAVWCTYYQKYLPQSALLLRHIKFSGEKSSLAKRPLQQTLLHFESINTTLRNSKEGKTKDSAVSLEGLEESSRAICDILQKADSSSKEKGFPFVKGSLVCFIGIIGLIIYDVRKNGGVLKDSSIGHLLFDMGALPAVESAMINVEQSYVLASKWASANVPTYCQTVLDVARPVVLNGIESMSHLTSCSCTYVMDMSHVIINWIDEQVPGYREKGIAYLAESWSLFKDYSWVALEHSKKYATVAFQWTTENVFVGKLSPENIQKLSLEAYNITQVYAGLTFDWIMEKIH